MMLKVKIIIALIILALSCSVSWFFTKNYYENKILQSRLELEEQQNKLAQSYAAEINKGIETHAENQTVINNLRNDLSKRVRIKLPSCTTTTPSKDQDGGSGLLSEGIDESFGRFEQRLAEIASRCDQLNIDAIRANETSPE